MASAVAAWENAEAMVAHLAPERERVRLHKEVYGIAQ
jgi:hypothetical protein